ncbi:MFS general substrate transporter [Auriculariales sp. MPI-PUGE-AT-0066]|nr:MFS general substrate transporter [Auriculariales sp. MPI-PUGE-AT-0066]
MAATSEKQQPTSDRSTIDAQSSSAEGGGGWEPQYLSGRALGLTIVANALPPIASAFHSLDQITWIPTAFLLTQAPFLPVFGQLNTLFSTKWLIMCSIAMFELGSLLSAVATSMIFLIVARAVQGIGAAGIFVCSITMMAEIVPLEKRPKLFGFFGGVFVIASILGPLIGGAFVDGPGWRWCFYLNLPLAVPTVLFLFQYFPANPAPIDRKNPPAPAPAGTNPAVHAMKRTARRLTEMDWIGAILSTGCTTCFVLALQWGGITKPWSSADVIAPLCVSAALLVALIGWEYRLQDKAMIPLKLFKNRTQVGSCLVSFFTRINMFIAIFELPLFFQAVKGHSPTKAGIDMIAITISLVFSSAVFGILTSKFGKMKPYMIIGPLFSAVGFGLVFIMDEHASWGLIIGVQILMGIGMGATMQNSMLAVQADTEKELIPQATGILTYIQFVGGTIGLAIAGGIFASKLKTGLEEFAPGAPVELLRQSVEALKSLPADQRIGAIHAYVKALQWCMAPLGCASSILCSLSALIIRNVTVKKPGDVPASDVESKVSEDGTAVAGQDLESGRRVADLSRSSSRRGPTADQPPKASSFEALSTKRTRET